MNTAKKSVSYRSVFVATSSFFIKKVFDTLPARKIVFYSVVLCCMATRYAVISTEQKQANLLKDHAFKVKTIQSSVWPGINDGGKLYNFQHQNQFGAKNTIFRQTNQIQASFIVN